MIGVDHGTGMDARPPGFQQFSSAALVRYPASPMLAADAAAALAHAQAPQQLQPQEQPQRRAGRGGSPNRSDAGAAAGGASDATAAAAASIPGTVPGDCDVRVSVMCGGVTGVLLLPKKRIIIHPNTEQAREVSPTEFERIAGKGAAKKWRQTIQARDGEWGGRPGASKLLNGRVVWDRGCCRLAGGGLAMKRLGVYAYLCVCARACAHVCARMHAAGHELRKGVHLQCESTRHTSWRAATQQPPHFNGTVVLRDSKKPAIGPNTRACNIFRCPICWTAGAFNTHSME